MGSYISNFQTIADYNAFKATNNFKTAHISLVKNDNNVRHLICTPYDYSKDYLTFEALESGTFTWTDIDNGKSIYYSLDNGSTWVQLTSGSSTPTINADDIVMFKGSNLSAISSLDSNGIGTFSSSGNFNVMGNIMSLIYGDNFINQLIATDYVFRKLFKNCNKLINTSNLILPATTLAQQCYYEMFESCTELTTAPALPATTLVSGCYREMFKNCSSLITAPELPATTLPSNCYDSMFQGCSNLNYIKAMFTTEPSTTYTNNWVNNVAASGTFVKNSAATWDITGVNGIPSGWTVQTASA